MDQLELAQAFLKRRAMSTEKVKNDKLILNQIEVISASEVDYVLQMVKKGTFLEYYNRFKKLGHQDFT